MGHSNLSDGNFNLDLREDPVSNNIDPNEKIIRFRDRSENKALVVASSGLALLISGAALASTHRRVLLYAGLATIFAGFVATVGGMAKFVKC